LTLFPQQRESSVFILRHLFKVAGFKVSGFKVAGFLKLQDLKLQDLKSLDPRRRRDDVATSVNAILVKADADSDARNPKV